MTNFNENETLVLKSLAKQMDNCTGGEFGFIEYAKRGNFSKHEFAGYIGSLRKKGAFEYLDTDSEFQGQFALKADIFLEHK